MGSCCCRSARATGRASWTRWRHRGCGAGDQEAWGPPAQRHGPARTQLDRAGPGHTSFSQEGRVGRSSRFSEVASPKFYLFIIRILATKSDVKNSKIQTPGPTTHLALVRQQHRIGRGLTNAPGSGDEGRQTGGRPDQGSGVRSWTSADLGAHPALPAHQLAFSEPPLCLGVFCRAVPTS